MDGIPAPIANARLPEIGAETASWVLLLNGIDFEQAPTETPQVGTVEEWVAFRLMLWMARLDTTTSNEASG